MVKTGEWNLSTANQFLKSKGRELITDVELEEIRDYRKRHLGSTEGLYPIITEPSSTSKGLSSMLNKWRRGGGAGGSQLQKPIHEDDIPRDPTFDMSKRDGGALLPMLS